VSLSKRPAAPGYALGLNPGAPEEPEAAQTLFGRLFCLLFLIVLAAC
jgi:hypothetical protein